MAQAQDNVVFIGNKPTMNYVLAVLTLFKGESNTVTIKARGKAISHAVDVAEIVRNRFIENLKIKDIRIKTENLTNKAGRKSNVSSIEIDLEK